MNDEELKHYGVKGMRWGVRKQWHKDIDKEIKQNNKVFRDYIEEADDYGSNINYTRAELHRLNKKISKCTDDSEKSKLLDRQNMLKGFERMQLEMSDYAVSNAEHAQNFMIMRYGEKYVKKMDMTTRDNGERFVVDVERRMKNNLLYGVVINGIVNNTKDQKRYNRHLSMYEEAYKKDPSIVDHDWATVRKIQELKHPLNIHLVKPNEKKKN